MDAVRFSASSVNFYQTKRHHIPEDSLIQSQRRENNKFLMCGFYPLVYSKELGTARTSQSNQFVMNE
jgi:hypothetical protein